MALATVLGSGVAVCCWNKSLRFGGMAHFCQPRTRNKKLATAKYGNVAIRHLIKLMTTRPNKVQDLVAHIVGGASQKRHGDPELSRLNVTIAANILRKYNITILSRDVGGDLGRKIAFDVSTGHIAVLKVERLRANDWYSLEPS